MNHVYEPNVAVKTRDGVALMVDVWRPAEGQTPTLLMRTPYDRREPVTFGAANETLPSLMQLVNAGYAVVLGDVRGTGTSEGTFEPKVNEIADGEDIVEWITSQGWSDGSVGTYGASYMGMVQWALATTGVPGVRAIAP
ncbi:CocE/NonD family hydrolase, partial [Mycobacteroides abscessus]